MRYHGLRMTIGTLLVAVIPIAAYCALYAELRSVKTYVSRNLDLKLNPGGLCAALCFLATSNLLIGAKRRATRTELVVQLTATPCTGLLIFWVTRGGDVPEFYGDTIPLLCYLGFLGLSVLAVVLTRCRPRERPPRTRREWVLAVRSSVAIGSLSLSLVTCYELFNVRLILGLGLAEGFMLLMLQIGLASLFIAAIHVPRRRPDEHRSRLPAEETNRSR